MTNLKKQLSLLAILMLSLAATANAQVNFTGFWKLSKENSDFGKLPPNSAPVIQNITQDKSKINVERHQIYANGDSTVYTEKLNLDGKSSEIAIKGDQKKTSTIKWSEDNKTLNIVSSYSNGIKAKESWSLAANGKLLTIEREAVIKDVPYKVKYVYDKQ